MRANTLCRNRDPREKPLHAKTDEIAQAGGAHGNDKKLGAGDEHRLAGEMALERADDKQRRRAQEDRQIKRRRAAQDDERDDRNDREPARRTQPLAEWLACPRGGCEA